LFREGITPETANSYAKRFNGEEIIVLINAGVASKRANQYHQRFNAEDIVCLAGDVIHPTEAEIYDERFSGADIAELIYREVSVRETRRYGKWFSAGDILALRKEDVSPKIANKYNPRFNGWDVILLSRNGISSREAESFSSRFNGYDISFLYGDVPPEEAEKYDPRFRSFEIRLLWQLGITPAIITPILQERLVELFKPLSDQYFHRTRGNGTRLIGTGISSVVMFEENFARKFSRKIKEEFNILKMIQDFYGGRQRNVVKLLGEPENNISLRIEYIPGESIGDLLMERRALSSADVLKSGADICNGLLEMRNVGVYHRDLHDRNVLADKVGDRSVIIDLGEATTDPEEIHHLNRAYGGNNDLISLGQLMYRMATGHNIFNEGRGFTFYSAVKEGVKTVREKTYDDPRRKVAMLKKVRKDIPDETLADIIVKLLDDDLWTQPSKEKVAQTLAKFDEVVQR
ncbi:MAG: protein kinase, partial [Nanoarchaeota archaeon]|nr:protein kinase [Nanoarchaeota archaeon]